MEAAGWSVFLSPAAPRVRDLYGASGGARVGESLAFALEMEQLEREERAFAMSVQALVRRPAPEPIGVKFYRPNERVSADARADHDSRVGGANDRGMLFPPAHFMVDESSLESAGLHEHAEGDEDDEGDELDGEDMDEDETDEDDVFTAEEDQDEDEDDEHEHEAEPFRRVMHEPRAGAARPPPVARQ